jgi:tetratricopeptide (TPR) repeat protein
MPRPWKRPDIPPSPLGELNRALHELHHRAGWPSSREIRRALDAKGVPMSHTKVHDTLTKPDLPAKGAVEMITEILAEAIRGADVHAEINRLLGLWDDASFNSQPPSPTTPASVEPSPVEKQADTEQRWREKAKDGDTEAMARLGDLLEKLGKDQEALIWYRRAAEAGHPDAMYYLGSLLEDWGTGEAVEYWFQRAAHAGQIEAMAGLGSKLERRNEYQEALIWYRGAAEAGHTDAMYDLGSLLKKRGQREESETWWRRAAQAGVVEAMRDLSALLRSRGVYTEADMWERRAKK